MARNKWGLLGHFVGKLGASVGYYRLGVPVTRALPHPTLKKRTDAQKASNKSFSLVMKYVAPINEFVKYSFKPAAMKKPGLIPQNVATSVVRDHAIEGEYPNLYINYSKVMVSLGNLQPPENPVVTLDGSTLTFKWDADTTTDWKRKQDQVMMLAYFPDTTQATFLVGGARRNVGQDSLDIQHFMKAKNGVKPNSIVETYIAFISNDRNSVSDSVYIGQISL